MQTIHSETDTLGLTIKYLEKIEDDYDEILGGYTPDTITYRPVALKRRECFAVAFEWAHPGGFRLSGAFSKPILILKEVWEDGDDEVDRDHFNGPVQNAILAKLGPVSGLEDIEVDFEGRE